MSERCRRAGLRHSHHKEKKSVTMRGDGGWLDLCDHFATCTNTRPLRCTPETNIMLPVTCISMKTDQWVRRDTPPARAEFQVKCAGPPLWGKGVQPPAPRAGCTQGHSSKEDSVGRKAGQTPQWRDPGVPLARWSRSTSLFTSHVESIYSRWKWRFTSVVLFPKPTAPAWSWEKDQTNFSGGPPYNTADHYSSKLSRSSKREIRNFTAKGS